MDIFLWWCPELLLSILCFFLLLLLRCRRNACGKLTNWPIVGMLPGFAVNTHRLHDFLTDLLSPSKTVIILGPWFCGMNLLITCDPVNVHHILTVNFHNYPKGHEFNEIFDTLGNGIFNADDESWRSQRKQMQLLVTQPSFRAFIARCSRAKVDNFLLPLLHQLSEQGKTVDLQDVFLRLSFDIACNLVFGEDLASLTEGFTIVPFAKAIEDVSTAILYRHVVPTPWWKLMRRLNIGVEKRHTEARLVIDDFIAESIKKTKQEGDTSANESLLKAYIKYSDVGGESGSNEFLRDTTLSLMAAGRDSIGVALAWFFYMLCKNPNVEEKLLHELRRVEEGDVYLHAALCEALRLYPSVPFDAKGVVKEENLPSGERVKPGMQVVFSTYTMARMEGVWGKDCGEFRPERWITEQGRVRYEPTYKFVTFNCGPRTCLGKDIAFTELKVAAAAVVREFRMEIVKGHVVEPKLSIILHMRNGLKVKVLRRVKN